MIEPALTASPSEALTPRRCALESRPFLVEPPPLVVDISLLVGGRDRRDLDRRVVLTVTPATAASRLGLVVVRVDLRSGGRADDPPRNCRAVELSRSGGDVLAVYEEHRGEVDLFADLGLQKLDLDRLTDFDSLLLSTRCNDCVHRGTILHGPAPPPRAEPG